MHETSLIRPPKKTSGFEMGELRSEMSAMNKNIAGLMGNMTVQNGQIAEAISDTITSPLKALGGPVTRSMSKKMLDDMVMLLGKCWLEEEAREKLGGGSKFRVMLELEMGREAEKGSGPLDPLHGVERPTQQELAMAESGRLGADRSELASHMERPALMDQGGESVTWGGSLGARAKTKRPAWLEGGAAEMESYGADRSLSITNQG